MNEEIKPSTPSTSDKDAAENKVLAAIGYLGILFLVPLLAKKESPFCQFHAKQSMILFIFEVIVSIFAWIPFIGWYIIIPIGYLAALILSIIGIINAFSEKTQPLPILGGFAEKIKI